jgi:hypothetical protein
MKNKKGFITQVVLLLILAVAVVAGYLYIKFAQSTTDIGRGEFSIPTFSPIPEVTTPADNTSATKLYTSEKLGIEFNYSPTFFDYSVSVKEIGNKIYVYDEKLKPEEGQYLEFFTKDPNDSLSTAINKNFLNCY